jgi:hypothetical protein
VGPRAGLDAVEKIKISCPCRESNPGSAARRSSLYRLNYPGSYYLETGQEGLGIPTNKPIKLSRS